MSADLPSTPLRPKKKYHYQTGSGCGSGSILSIRKIFWPWYSYVSYYNIPAEEEYVRAEALKWAMARGNRSGRTAHQFIVHLAMEFNMSI